MFLTEGSYSKHSDVTRAPASTDISFWVYERLWGIDSEFSAILMLSLWALLLKKKGAENRGRCHVN
jgi:hypothetical protein